MFGDFSPRRRLSAASRRTCRKGRNACLQLARAVGLSFVLQACVTVYHPLSGLHRPVALNMSYANFANLKVALRCLPGDVVNAAQAEVLCRKLKSLFESQGAQVRLASDQGDFEPILGDLDSAAGTKLEKASNNPELTIRLSSRLLHQDTTSYLFFDVVTGYTFAQDISVTDDRGFLLIQDHLTGRFVQRIWLYGSQKSFSNDFYGQVSQLTLNAQMRRRVLLESTRQQTSKR